ncbi:MAG: outer membrane protein assembly factor BamE [Pseudomonadales bacterium]|nr:outer membrane protein assembly factor BamE [Pseudomonadales bacterium]
MLVRALSTTLIAMMLTGCSLPNIQLPRLYKVTVQQGNVITQEMVNQLKPGMTRSQVAFIMGEPVLRNTFNENRWDYVYSVVLPGYFNQETRMSLFFEDDVLGYFTGDLVPESANPDSETETDTDTDTAEETS